MLLSQQLLPATRQVSGEFIFSEIVLQQGKPENARPRSTKGTMDPEGTATTVVTAGHCTHAELTSGHALASCYSCCVHSRVYAN